MKKLILSFFTALVLISCSQKEPVDLLVYNATIYTVDSSFSTAEAMTIKDGKIVELGKLADLESKYDPKERLDAGGKFIYPGFIDAHAHFLDYGYFLQTINLNGTKSWQEALDRTIAFSRQHNDGWIRGRGWDQNDWVIKEFPDKTELDSLFPDRPVLLQRVDGHAAIANRKALDIAGIKPGMKIAGGEIEVKNNQLTGILIDNAITLVSSRIQAPDKNTLKEILKIAEEQCFAAGLTTLDDCGDDYNLGYRAVEYIREFHNTGDLKIRLYLMLGDFPENYAYLEKNGIIKTARLHVRGFKVYGDGALGSRGACLLQPYSDKPGHYGFLLSRPEHFDSVARWISQKGFQMCTHAIGDSGNRTILNTYAKYLKGKNDLRWRIEHAQVVNQSDFNLFGMNSIIPSVQPTHATSDMYWAGDRLGAERVKGAYAYKQLLQQNGWIPLGTDFPIEDISPFKTFYAAVIRKDANGWPEGGYQMVNALSREEALRGMTIWAAKSNFEEKEKGSLEKGKLADFIILDKDLLKMNENEILQTIVLKTFVGGEKVYERK